MVMVNAPRGTIATWTVRVAQCADSTLCGQHCFVLFDGKPELLTQVGCPDLQASRIGLVELALASVDVLTVLRVVPHATSALLPTVRLVILLPLFRCTCFTEVRAPIRAVAVTTKLHKRLYFPTSRALLH